MPEIVTRLEIDASPEEVWEQFLAKERWQEFSAFVDMSPRRPIVVGSHFWFGIRLLGLPPPPLVPMPLRVTVRVCDAPDEVRWFGGIPAFPLFRGEHYFQFEKAGPGRTRFVHGERFHGPLSGPVVRGIGEILRQTYEAFNNGLAHQVYRARR